MVTEPAAPSGNAQASAAGHGYSPGIAEQMGYVPARLAQAGPARVIDLSNSDPGPPQRGGHDPGVPTVITRHEITGRLLIGHTTDLDDPDAPIIIREAGTVRPGADGTAYADGRCRSCVAHPALAVGDGQAVLIIGHEPGCRAMAKLLRAAGRRP
jgi:hypothetical protein